MESSSQADPPWPDPAGFTVVLMVAAPALLLASLLLLLLVLCLLRRPPPPAPHLRPRRPLVLAGDGGAGPGVGTGWAASRRFSEQPCPLYSDYSRLQQDLATCIH